MCATRAIRNRNYDEPLCNVTTSMCHFKSGHAVRALMNLNSLPAIRGNEGMCDEISDDLPSFCQCANTQYGFVVDCSVDFLDLDTIGLKADIKPCGNPASMSLDITEADLGIDYPIAMIQMGTTKNFPIPGLSVDIPIVGNAGVQVAVVLNGNLNDFDVKVGLNACGTILYH